MVPRPALELSEAMTNDDSNGLSQTLTQRWTKVDGENR
jgi:hypothetical protein